jgi:hypothetical protein
MKNVTIAAAVTRSVSHTETVTLLVGAATEARGVVAALRDMGMADYTDYETQWATRGYDAWGATDAGEWRLRVEVDPSLDRETV